MDDLQALAYAEELLHRQDEEECEHGIHKDSGHICWECWMNRSNEDGPE